MSKDKFSWTDLIPRLPGWIKASIAFVSAVVAFVILWQGNRVLVTTVLLVIVVGGGWLSCAYLAFSRTKPKRRKSKRRRKRGPWKYPRWRPWALAGLVIIPLLTAGGVGYHLYQRAQPPSKVIVLVARFDGPEPERYHVTDTILNRLREATEQYDDVEIVPLGEVITEEQGSAVARAAGERRKAAIVIWGWYGVTEEAVPLSVHFEVLREPKYMPEIGSEAKGQVRTMAVAMLESFDLQTELSGEMTYLTLFTVGMTRFAAEDYDGAIVCFGHALSQTEERAQALDQSVVYSSRGAARLLISDYDRAIEDYDQAIRLNPGYAEAYYNRGNAHYYKGDYDRAIEDYDQAIRLNPGYAEAYYNRGCVYHGKGELGRAIADYSESIRLQPDDPKVYYNRGNAYRDKGDLNLAIADYNQAIELKPDYAKAYANRGSSYTGKGNYDRAIVDLDKAIKLNTPGLNLSAAYNARGNAYAAKGDHDRAISDYNQALQLQPDWVCAYYNRGNAYADKGDYDRAIQDYDKAISLNPNYAVAYYNRGLAHKQKGKKERAIADFKKFLELTDDPYWRQRAEQQLQELGAK